MFEIKLTETEIEELRKFHRTLKDKKSSDRIKAILMLNKGYSGKEVAEVLILDENTISEWKKNYIKRINFTNWLFHSCQGYSGKLTKTEEKLVEQYVEEHIITDSKKVKEFIQIKFGKTYTVNGVIELLKRIGFRYKNTKLIPSKFNPELQKEWKETYEEFANNLKEDETILFGDGMHPTHNSVCGKAWIKQGKEKKIKSNAGRRRINLNGGYNPIENEVIVKDYKTLNTASTIEYFKYLENYYHNKAHIYYIVDNARYYKNPEVLKYTENSRIKLIFLPTYSPNLNLIERFWKVLKKEVIRYHYYEKFKDFRVAILDFCNKSSPEFKQLLRKSVGHKLHLLAA